MRDGQSEAVLSIAAQAKGVSICFIQGAKLPDPTKALSGSGNQTRSLHLEHTEVLSRADVEELIKAALALEKTPMPKTNGYTVIKSVSNKQRPRRIVTKKSQVIHLRKPAIAPLDPSAKQGVAA